MTEIKLKNRLGLSIFFGQISLLLLVLFSPFYGVDFPHSMSLLTVVAPISGAYAVVVVRYFVSHRHPVATKDRTLEFPFVVIAVAAPIALYLATIVVFLAYALDWWNVSLEDTRFALTSLEGLFGVYLGMVVDALFKSSHSKE